MAKLAFDTGGTFTDFALLDDKGELHLHKVLSTPNNPAEAVVRGVSELLEQGIKSVAVCLLHAYKYPAHEQRIAALLREENPDIFVSLSSEVCPEVREFDRASTTVINAYTRPQMSGHVAHLEREFAAKGI